VASQRYFSAVAGSFLVCFSGPWHSTAFLLLRFRARLLATLNPLDQCHLAMIEVVAPMLCKA